MSITVILCLIIWGILVKISKIDYAIDMFSKSEALVILRDYLLSVLDCDGENLILDNCNLRVERKIDLGYEMFAIEQKYRLNDECIFESHRKYIDFQLIISGVECIEVGDRDSFDIKNEYDLNKDITLFNQRREVSRMIVYPRDLVVFFPNDVHRCGLKVGQIHSNLIFKSVVKVPCSLLKFRF